MHLIAGAPQLLGDDMIIRMWRGSAQGDGADAYFRHVTETVFPTLKALPGHQGAKVLRREVDGAVEFLVVTLWDSMDAVRAFAGPDPDVAVVEPQAEAVLAEFDRFVRHYELAHVAPCS